MKLSDLIPSATEIDNGYWQISQKTAKGLCGGQLPKHGSEKRIEHAGYRFWIARTPHQGKQVWSVRFADWRTQFHPTRCEPLPVGELEKV